MSRRRPGVVHLLCVLLLSLLAIGCGREADTPGGEGSGISGSGGSSGGNGSGTGATGTGAGGGVQIIDGGIPDTGVSGGDGGECILPDGGPCIYDVVDAGPHCGDGLVNVTGEECDDGNALPGDGCSGICTREMPLEYWDCPPDGGPCVSTIVCGDGAREGVEGCDDGNAISGDGCSDTCHMEPGWFCATPGAPCERLVTCGDGRLQMGEVCDDGNTTSGDGCDEFCRTEPGYRCLRPNTPCEVIPVCGDGVVSDTEGCDDGNASSGDGCSDNCRIEAAYYDCVPGQLCVSTVQCGDGRVEAEERCDDGNTSSNDGCSSICQPEPGWVCRMPGARCIPDCGDGRIITGEECDDGNEITGDGCSSTCRIEPGWLCPAVGQPCTQTVCGNGVREGTEICDLGADNGMFYGDGSGCSMACTPEPLCRPAGGGPTRACDSVCGDGMRIGAEACDDGNLIDGDGCSSSCTVEAGFTCVDITVSDTRPCATGGGDCLILPAIFRDFKSQNEAGGHPDFFYMGASGISGTTYCVPNASNTGVGDSTELCLNLVQQNLDNFGKPVFNAGRPGGNACACRFQDWDETGIIAGVPGAVQEFWYDRNYWVWQGNVPVIRDAASFAQWYTDVAGVNTTVRGTLELSSIGGGQYQFSSSDGRSVYDDIAENVPLNSGFFPLESQPGTKICNLWTYWINWPGCTGNQWNEPTQTQVPATGVLRNFYFTTEVRYLLVYDGGTATLSFFGDDDVWVFVNGRLALDLGGTHERLAGSLTISPATADGFGLSPGNVYEIVVFHADRHPRDSNYQLTLSGFDVNRSACGPTCGDGVVTVMEECDEGPANNDAAYGGCRTDCTFGPFCGDGIVNGPEQCDDGQNVTVGYNMSGCAPGCVLPPRCGDGVLDPQEECDDGDALNTGQYNQCRPDCLLGAYCGDGIVQADSGEQCDDGLNIGGYGQCAPGCVWGPRCGDGVLDSDQGETCDDGNNIDGDGCSSSCGVGGYCGDGIVQPELGETCDDGYNDGTYGRCSIDCQVGPRCGDGVVQAEAGEQCDYGDAGNADGVYGGCSTRCTFGPHCGDGILHNPPEECDDGNNVSHDGCSANCISEVRIE